MDLIKNLLARLMAGLSSNAGNNAQAVMWGTFGVFVPLIAGFDKEEYRLAAFVVFCIAMALICWRTRGSGLNPEEGAVVRDRLDTLEDVLNEDRR